MFAKFKKFINGKTTFAEILRFVFVGGLATVTDFLVMALTLYLFAPENYPDFISIFVSGNPTFIAAATGTGAGFIAGLLVNYFLSVLFVYNDEGNSKSIKGFLTFALLSAVGLLIHEAGMYFLYSVCHVNEWLVKIFLTVVVLVYNYLTRKCFIFRNKTKQNGTETNGRKATGNKTERDSNKTEQNGTDENNEQ